jgi:hypothetical protein
MITLAYDIRPNLDHIPKRPKQGEVATFDIVLFPEGCIRNWDLINSETYNGPDPINFLGWIERLSKTDFPRNIPGLPIISKQMLEILLSVDNFPHRAIPTRIFPYDLRYTGDTGEHWDLEDLPIELCNQDYVAVQLLEYTNATDYDRSTFRTHPAFPDEPPVIDRLVLHRPSEGFPPLFRVDSSPSKLFISPSAKTALESKKIVLNYVEWNESGASEIVYKLPDNSEIYN